VFKNQTILYQAASHFACQWSDIFVQKKAFLREGANNTIPSKYIVQAANYFVLESKPCFTKKFNQAVSEAKLHVCRTIEQTILYHKANHALQ
jgi:hypothetical protein